MAISAELGPVLENYVSGLVSEGRYNSKSEVLREGIRLVQEREQRLAALDAAIAAGRADVAAGRVISIDDAFDRLDAKFAASAPEQ